MNNTMQHAGPSPQNRAAFSDRYLTEMTITAERDVDNVINAICKETDTYCPKISDRRWGMLRAAFGACLEVLELRRRCCEPASWSSEQEKAICDLVEAMLRTESRFGGVTNEELIRVFRVVYPRAAERLLPRTAMELWRDYNEISRKYVSEVGDNPRNGEWQTQLHSVSTGGWVSIASSSNSDSIQSGPSSRGPSKRESVPGCYSWSLNHPFDTPLFGSANPFGSFVLDPSIH